MKIFVKVKPKARVEKVERVDDTHFIVFTKELPEKGKANEGVIRLLSAYFAISRAQIIIISGQKSRTKVVLIK